MLNNFEFYNPTKLIFGNGQIANIANYIPAKSKILLAYGMGSIKKNGIYNEVISALKNYNIIEFGGIEANPTYQTLMNAVNIARDNNIDFILAVGGGSVIDGTKFISAAINFNGNEWDILSKGAKISSVAPFGAVLTLPATGSEMNSGAVISNSGNGEKRVFANPLCYPKFSILEPKVILSLPKTQIANGIVDAFIHTLEQYITYPVNADLHDKISEGILKTLIDNGRVLYNNSSDENAAHNVMFSATMALNGLISTGVPSDWATHMIGHELTAIYKIDHAKTLAIILPKLYRVLIESKNEKLAQYGRNVWSITKGTELEIAEKAIIKTEEFFNELNIKTNFSDYFDNKQEALKIIIERFKSRKWHKLGEKGLVTPEIITEIFISNN